MDYEDSLSTITAMRHQEETAYRVTDYFQTMRQRHAHHSCCSCYDSDCSDTEGLSDSESTYKSCSSTASESCSSCASAASPSSSKNPCDPSCRAIMFQWMVRLVDFFPSMHRETVAYAMDFLDRFLQTPSGRGALQQRSVFQLAAISCLYTAVKMHESAAVSPKFLEQLSRDEYTVQDVERMELCILRALEWRLSTPTATAFLRLYLDIVPDSVLDQDVRDEVYGLAKFQTELALGDYKYVTVKTSIIAYASLMNALHILRVPGWNRIGWFVSKAADLMPTEEDNNKEHTTSKDDSANCRYIYQIQRDLANDHASHTDLESSSIGYENNRTQKKPRQGRRTSGRHHSPRTVLNKAA